jgi:hypothetical protein
MAQPVHERTLDREDALLSAWRRRRDTPRLTDEHVIEPAEIDLDRWRLDLQILTQTAKRHPRSSCWSPRHRQESYPAVPILSCDLDYAAGCCPATHAVLRQWPLGKRVDTPSEYERHRL